MEYKNGSALSMSAEPFPLHHSFFNYVVVTQHFFDYRPPDNVENGFLQCVERPGKFDFQRGFAVHKLDGAVEKLADIINTSPYFRHTTVYFEKSINSFHSSTYRILCCENSISWSFSKLSEESEVDTSIRDNIRAVTFCTWHEECCDVRHHCRYTDCTVFCQIHDLIFRNTKVIEPFCCDFFSGTVFHRLLDIVTRHISK